MRSLVPGYLQLSILSNFGVNELINQFVTIYFFLHSFCLNANYKLIYTCMTKSEVL